MSKRQKEREIVQQSHEGADGADNKCSSTKKLEALILMRAEKEKCEGDKAGTEKGQRRARKGRNSRARAAGTEGGTEGGKEGDR